MQKFMSGGYNFNGNLIEVVDVERESDSSVWVNGRRRAKRSSHDNFFDTWDEAHAYILGKSEAALNSARRRLEQRQGDHGNIIGMKRPEGV